MGEVFSRVVRIDLPDSVNCNEAGRSSPFEIRFLADGEIPFPQVILHAQGQQHLIKEGMIQKLGAEKGQVTYVASVPAGLVGPGEIGVQVEGCRKEDWRAAGGEDWIKEYARIRIRPRTESAAPAKAVQVKAKTVPRTILKPGTFSKEPKVYFGIHKHMHQPYYRSTDPNYWDGEKEEIFGSRGGPYTEFIPAAVRQYIDGVLPHAGLSTSWSGTLIEQLNRCARDGLCGGRFSHWSEQLRAIAGEKTGLGNPRVDFTAFGFFHPLMALTPGRNIVKQISMHREILRETFAVEASPVMFPPETAFHVRMIPALNEAGIEAVIYDSIHRFRTCKEYPYAGINEGMLPPNPADQRNPPANDWLQLHNIWAGSKIAPSLLRPEYVQYEDPDGHLHKIIAVPAERYIGNEDARGGFGALQYPDVLGQLYDQIAASRSYDPQHPPFFVLHSDGDNHGGGAESYYKNNTGALVDWLKRDSRFDLITIQDYLKLFPPDPNQAVHIEPGSWSGADNGDPQFMKWFSRYNEPYSPDLNSWAVLTALHNAVHSLEDAANARAQLGEVTRLMLTAETSCYWYWTGQSEWDVQVTSAANAAHRMVKTDIDGLVSQGKDETGPTIFPPWIIPENPGGKKWGQGCLQDAPREGVVHSLIYDVSGLNRVSLVLRTANAEKTVAMTDNGPYPSQTSPDITAQFFTSELPVGAGEVSYYIEAVDGKGNVSRSSLERVYLA
jgi:hypothetical protein